MTNHDSSPDAFGLFLSESANSDARCVGAGVFADSSRQTLRELSDMELLASLSRLVKQDRDLTVEILLHLGEVESRGLHYAKGCSSLFTYCVERLGFSEEVAYKRVGAARLGRMFPLALELLAQGQLHLTALMLIRPHLNEENHREWLMAACHKTKREVEVLVATRCPRPDVPSVVRRLPERRGAVRSAHAEVATSAAHAMSAKTIESTGGATTCATSASTTDATTPDHSSREALPTCVRASVPVVKTANIPRVDPLSGASYRVVFTASDALKKKLDRASELVSHSVEPGNLPALIERAVDLLIEREEKRRFAVHANGKGTRTDETENVIRKAKSQTGTRDSRGAEVTTPMKQHEEPRQQDPDLVRSEQRPPQNSILIPDGLQNLLDNETECVSAAVPSRRQAPQRRRLGLSVATTSRYVPAEVRRGIWQRNGGQCTFIDAEGNRCKERRLIQIEHCDPFARGGPSTVENCCLLCAGHNQYRAREVFGETFMEMARGNVKAK